MGCISTLFLILLPDFVRVVIAAGHVQGQEPSPARLRPELAAAFEAALQRAQGFHGAAAHRSAFRRPRLILDMS